MKKDMTIIKQILKEENKSLVIMGSSGKIFSSCEKGIKPLFETIRDFPDDMTGASAADKVTGKGAAMLVVHSGIKELYSGRISKPALEFLKQNNVSVEYDELTENILNRTKTDLCPVEKMTLNINDTSEAYTLIENFIKTIKENVK